MNQPQLLISVLPLLVALAPAQQFEVYPPAARAGDLPGSTNSPFRRSSYERALYVHDRTMFAPVAASGPIEIHAIRYRADAAAGSWAGTTIADLRVDMSHGVVAFDHALETFDDNHGSDRTTVFHGPLAVPAGSLAMDPFAIRIPLQQPFVFDPARGDDLVIDIVNQGALTSTGLPTLDGASGSSAGATRVSSFDPASATGSSFGAIHAFELEFVAATGLHPAYSVDVRSGGSPLTVQFTDRTFTSDPGGVLSYAWDFDADGTVDSTVQNPTHVFAGCGEFSPVLTVTDATGTATFQRTDWVVTDVVDAAFEAVTRNGAGPLTVQFNDLSTGSPTSWAWDFDGDGLTDSTLQNPTHTFAPGYYDVSLTVGRACRSDSVTRVDYIVAYNALWTAFGGNDRLDAPGVYFANLTVMRPEGIRLTALDTHCQEPVGTSFDFDVYVSSAPYQGITDDRSAWRKLTSGTALSNGIGVPTLVDIDDAFLPTGVYGIAIQMVGATLRYTRRPATVTRVNADIQFEMGASRSGFFAGTLNTNRVYNGTLYYDYEPTGTVNTYGLGCAGSAGVPSLGMSAGTALRTGQTFGLELGALPPTAAFSVLFYGYNHTSSNGAALPLPLDGFGLPGCVLRAEAFVTELLLNSGGQATWSASLPMAPVLVGTPVFFQALVPDAGANAAGAVVSDSVAGRIGG